jgi:hypothetical protein
MGSGSAACLLLFPLRAIAQQPQAPQPPQPQPQPPNEWAKLPRMQLDRQFAGPLQDTIVQRWRDPADGTICYIYLPVTAAHSPPTANGYVQYGANTIGSISCFATPPHHAGVERKSLPSPSEDRKCDQPARRRV